MANKELSPKASEVLKKAKEELANVVASVIKNWGYCPAVGKIYVALLLSDKPSLTLREISEATKYAVPTISKNIRILEKLRFVKRIKKPGTKEIEFTIVESLDQVLKNFIKYQLHRDLTRLRDGFAKCEEILKSAGTDELNKYINRIEVIKDYCEIILEMVSIFAKLPARKIFKLLLLKTSE